MGSYNHLGDMDVVQGFCLQPDPENELELCKGMGTKHILLKMFIWENTSYWILVFTRQSTLLTLRQNSSLALDSAYFLANISSLLPWSLLKHIQFRNYRISGISYLNSNTYWNDLFHSLSLLLLRHSSGFRNFLVLTLLRSTQCCSAYLNLLV